MIAELQANYILVYSAIDAILTRALKVWLYPDVIFNLTKTSKVFYESIEYMRSVSNFVGIITWMYV